MPSRGGTAPTLDFDVTYHRFSKTWFVQPFLDRGLAEAGASVAVDREDGARVRVRIEEPSRR